MPDGTQRIILATDRRLGVANPSRWATTDATDPATTDKFTVLELRIDPKGVGEGKASLHTKVTVDAISKSIALDKYTETTAVLKNIKRTNSAQR
jgi:hypothetical protein